MPKGHNTIRASRRKAAPGSDKARFDHAFVDVLSEFEAMVELAKKQREMVERELGKTKAGELGSKQYLVWMAAKLGDLVTRLLREGRQLQKAYAAEERSEQENYEILLAAGWKPPPGWVMP